MTLAKDGFSSSCSWSRRSLISQPRLAKRRIKSESDISECKEILQKITYRLSALPDIIDFERKKLGNPSAR